MSFKAYDTEDLRALGRMTVGAVMDDEELRGDYIRLVRYGLSPECKSRAIRTEAMRQYCKLMSDCGLERNVQLAQTIILGIGALSEDDARRRIALTTEAEALTSEQQIRAMTDRIHELVVEDPALRALATDCMASLLGSTLLLPPVNGHGS